MEFIVTRLAEYKIMESVKLNKEIPVLRIYVEKASCSGARFGIAFDNIKTGDEVTDFNDIKFVTDTEYLPQYAEGLSIDYSVGQKEGFIIKPIKTPSRAKEGCAGGCSGGCGSCGH